MEKREIKSLVKKLQKKYSFLGPYTKTNISPLGAFMLSKDTLEITDKASDGNVLGLDEKSLYQRKLEQWDNEILPVWKRYYHKRLCIKSIALGIILYFCFNNIFPVHSNPLGIVCIAAASCGILLILRYFESRYC